MNRARRCQRLLFMVLLVAGWSVGGVPEARAADGYTELSYANGQLSGYSETIMSSFDNEEAYCQQYTYVLVGGTIQQYCSLWKIWYPAYVAQWGRLYKPDNSLFSEEYGMDEYDSTVNFGTPPDQYGTWRAVGTHYLIWEILYQECYNEEDCYDAYHDHYETEAATPPTITRTVEVINISPTWVVWDPTDVTVPPVGQGCTTVRFDENIGAVNLEWRHRDDGLQLIEPNFPNNGQSCVTVNQPWAFGTYDIVRIQNVAGGPWFTPTGPPSQPTVIIRWPTPSISSISPSGALRGTSGQLTITGQFAAWEPSLSSGSTALSISSVSVSATSIVADYITANNMPGGAYNLSVSNAGGNASTSFTIADPTPAISSITPGQGEAGTIVNVTILGAGFGSNPSVEVSPSFPVNISPISDTQIDAAFSLTNSTTGDYAVTVTSHGYGGGNFTPIQGGQQPTSNTAGFAVTPPPPPTLTISTADIVQDQIIVTLGPSGYLGTLTVRVGPTTVSTINSAPYGNHIVSFSRETLPDAPYTTVTAEWVTAVGTATNQKSVNFEVFGHDWQQTFYNIPHENQCGGDPQNAWFVTRPNNICNWAGPYSLREQFAQQVAINGTGEAINPNYGFLKTENAFSAQNFPNGVCYAHDLGNGAGNAGRDVRDYRQVAGPTGASGLGLNNNTVARYNGRSSARGYVFEYGDTLLITGGNAMVGSQPIGPAYPTAVKTVTDRCGDTPGGCGDDPHLDNFHESRTCNPLSFTNYRNTTVIRLH